jgi:hypothetical protein
MIAGLVFLVCFVVVVSGCTTSTNTTTSNPSSSNTSSSNNSSATSNEVLVVVTYSGNWAADVSGSFGYRSLSGSGDQTNSLGSISGPVTASVRKTEGGNGVLTVTIKRGGQTLSSASTDAPYGAATAVYTG